MIDMSRFQCENEGIISDMMHDKGFKEKKRFVLYEKSTVDLKQRIEMNVESYHGCYKFLYPYYEIRSKRILQIAKEITQNDDVFGRAVRLQSAILREPIQTIHKTDMWMIKNNVITEKLLYELTYYFEKYVFPLLVVLQKNNGIIELYERRDQRIIMSDLIHVFVMSAYVECGDVQKAISVYENRFVGNSRNSHISILEKLVQIQIG